MRPNAIKATTTMLVCAALVAACGGGGGGGNGNGDNTGGNPAITYTATLTDVALIDTRTGQAINVTGLPIQGATVTKN